MNLWRVGIDERSGRVLGRLEAITTPSPHSGPISISSDGRIAYVEHLTTANIQAAGFDPIKERITRSRNGSPKAPGRRGILMFHRTTNGWRSLTKASRKTFSLSGSLACRVKHQD